MDNQAFLSYDCEAALVAGAGQGAEQGAGQEEEKAAPSPVSPSSPQAGVYSVSSGCVLQPATVIYLHSIYTYLQYFYISTYSCCR